MPLAEGVNLFSRCGESGPPPGEPEFRGPEEYGPCLQILKAMNRIMAEHFGIPPGPKETANPAGGAGSQTHEGSRRHE